MLGCYFPGGVKATSSYGLKTSGQTYLCFEIEELLLFLKNRVTVQQYQNEIIILSLVQKK